MTTLTESPERAGRSELDEARGRVRKLTVTVTVLAVALIGLAAWVAYDSAVTPDAGMTSEVEALIDDYVAAWNNGDVDAFLSLVTDDYTFENPGALVEATVEEMAANFPGEGDFQVEILGEPLMIGDGPTYYLVTVDEITESGSTYSAVSHYDIVESGGVLKFQSHAIVTR